MEPKEEAASGSHLSWLLPVPRFMGVHEPQQQLLTEVQAKLSVILGTGSRCILPRPCGLCWLRSPPGSS